MLQSPGPLAGREGSGWVKTLQEVELATPGITHPFPKASHVTRTRHAHLVITCVLYILLKNACDVYVATNAHCPAECFTCTCGANAEKLKVHISSTGTQALNWNCLSWHLGIHYILVTLVCTKTH